MGNRLRVATWNVDRSGVRKIDRLKPQLEVLASINADILILTETHESAKPSGYEYHLASEPAPRYHKSGESCASIWSRYPLAYLIGISVHGRSCKTTRLQQPVRMSMTSVCHFGHRVERPSIECFFGAKSGNTAYC